MATIGATRGIDISGAILSTNTGNITNTNEAAIYTCPAGCWAKVRVSVHVGAGMGSVSSLSVKIGGIVVSVVGRDVANSIAPNGDNGAYQAAGTAATTTNALSTFCLGHFDLGPGQTITIVNYSQSTIVPNRAVVQGVLFRNFST